MKIGGKMTATVLVLLMKLGGIQTVGTGEMTVFKSKCSILTVVYCLLRSNSTNDYLG